MVPKRVEHPFNKFWRHSLHRLLFRNCERFKPRTLCRDRGLIPQGKKFAIVELKSLKDALGTLPSIPSEGGKSQPTTSMSQAHAVKHFREAIGGRPLRVMDRSRLRYVLFRAPLSGKIRKWVLQLMQHHPEHIEPFAAYLREVPADEGHDGSMH